MWCPPPLPSQALPNRRRVRRRLLRRARRVRPRDVAGPRSPVRSNHCSRATARHAAGRAPAPAGRPVSHPVRLRNGCFQFDSGIRQGWPHLVSLLLCPDCCHRLVSRLLASSILQTILLNRISWHTPNQKHSNIFTAPRSGLVQEVCVSSCLAHVTSRFPERASAAIQRVVSSMRVWSLLAVQLRYDLLSSASWRVQLIFCCAIA